MKTRILGNTGLEISQLGFGAAGLGNVYRDVGDDEVQAAVDAAIDLGITYFDVAPSYGLTLAEQRLGRALSGKRDSIVLATKCCRESDSDFDFSAARVASSLDESLARLQTDYVDIFQIHDVEFASEDQVLHETIPAALAQRQAGKARFVGITGLPVRYLKQIAAQAQLDTLLSWGHYTLIEDELDELLVPFCADRGIGLMNASPLLQGLLTDRPPPKWHRSPPSVLEVAPRISKLCQEAGFATATVALKHSVRYPHVATTIVSMENAAEVEQNVAAINTDVPDELYQRIAQITAPIMNRMWFEGIPENNIPPSDPNRYVPRLPHQAAGG